MQTQKLQTHSLHFLIKTADAFTLEQRENKPLCVHVCLCGCIHTYFKQMVHDSQREAALT